MVVVRAPDLSSKERELLLAVALQGWEVRRSELDVDAEVLLQLRLHVPVDLVVGGVGVVAELETLDLAAGRVPLLVEGHCSVGVELRVRVGTIAEVALQTLADHAAGHGRAGGGGWPRNIGQLR